jgi:RNA recognition motif-containing protein
MPRCLKFKTTPMYIHVSNLDSETTTADISNLFLGFGKIRVGKIRAIRNILTRLPGTFVFVDVEDKADAEKAILTLNNTVLLGSKIALAAAN